jgi:glutathione S-transferase
LHALGKPTDFGIGQLALVFVFRIVFAASRRPFSTRCSKHRWAGKMKLHHSSASQFVRKVMVVAIELGLEDRLELIADKTDLETHNPLLKRPALVTDDNDFIIDSPVICAYLDELAGDRLIPRSAPARWRALSQEALADGVMEAVTAIRVERAFHAGDESTEWTSRQMLKIDQGLDAFETQAARGVLDGPVTIGQITVGALCGYLDFLFADYPWRANRPSLDAWYARFAQRDSMKRTIPQQPPGRVSALAPRQK